MDNKAEVHAPIDGADGQVESSSRSQRNYCFRTTDQMNSATSRLPPRPQTIPGGYEPPENFLEVDVVNPETHGIGSKKYTDYEIKVRTSLPIFKLKESSVRRRYSEFEWLKQELERDIKILVPPLPGKAIGRQLPFRSDQGIFAEGFIEDRRQQLEAFLNRVAGHPLAQNEKCLHMFLQEPVIDKNYTPGKVRQF